MLLKKRNDRITVYFEPIFPVSSVSRLTFEIRCVLHHVQMGLKSFHFHFRMRDFVLVVLQFIFETSTMA